jgi:hypothetical protein
MDKDKTKARRVLELILLAAIVVCIALVLVELAGNAGGEVYGARESWCAEADVPTVEA